MLLPSALSCDSRQHPTRSRFTGRLFPSTPPPSDDIIAGNGLLGTCRALQSLLNVSPASSPRRAKPDRLQSPLQIQPKQPKQPSSTLAPKKIVKPSRGVNKRRREAYEELYEPEPMNRSIQDLYSTPKRQRRAPLDLPLGLETSDFRTLETPQDSDLDLDLPSSSSSSTQFQIQPQQIPHHPPPSGRHRRGQWDISGDDFNTCQVNPHAAQDCQSFSYTSSSSSLSDSNSSDWTSEDDSRLVELVLEKLKLSKRDWNDCARRMGKDHDSVGRRWKSLVGEGNVGLRRGRRMVRGQIDEGWRHR